MIYYKSQYNLDQYPYKDTWVDLAVGTVEEVYKTLLHLSLKTDPNSYFHCRVVKVTEEQIYFDERPVKEEEDNSVYVD